MQKHKTFQFTGSLDAGLVVLDGYIATDHNGDVVNSTTKTDAWGDPLPLPRGISACSQVSTGLYRLTLDDNYWKVRAVQAIPFCPITTVDGFMQVVAVNPRGSTVEGHAAQTIDIRFIQAGSIHALPEGGFSFMIWLKNINV